MNNYKDVTKEWLKRATPNSHKIIIRDYIIVDKIKYKINSKNKNVIHDYTNNELKIAKWLKNTFGGKIYLNPRVNFPQKISTSDYIFKNKRYDLKTIYGSGSRTIKKSVKKAKMQANNFIIDVTNSNLSFEEIKKQIDSIYSNSSVKKIDIIIIKRKNNFIIYKNNKKSC